MTDSRIVEKLNQIRHKLDKYSKAKDILKIKAYLSELNNIQNINLSILQESQIVECLKILKKKDNPDYSPKADIILKKWKTIITQMTAQAENEGKHHVKTEKVREDNKELSASFTDKKRSSSVVNDSNSKKLKLSDTPTKSENKELAVKKEPSIKSEPKETNPFESLSNKNSSINKSQPTKSESYLALPIVPIPTSRLEDILSVESMPSSNHSSTSKNFHSFAQTYVKQETPFNQLDDDDALAKILMAKQSKRLLYTGRKNNPNGTLQVPKLFELATRNLIENLDDVHQRISSYNSKNQFPIVYDVIAKVLERANAKQLQNIEYYSPNLLEDTEDLWKKLCEHEFKQACTPEEDENWRELYFRKQDEREEKFRRARDFIARKQAEKPKERQTKEATVKFVASTARSSSTVLSQSNAASKLKILNSSAGPVRQIVHDSSSKKGGSSSLGPKRPVIPSGPAMSQGMKATMKLIKKTTSRR